ncbi:hypothetical protein EB809_05125 [Marinobacter sp. R17]|uniref:hypothetical protein n=1 Tax=Marinobacter sp. R17 TaxID=2484250 RepID=UPI000F4C1464|nr:hypothetical protein [Marinobacter sp. R17]ROU01474.1 hypothetical protein EB809_05125 [Marinobacter sp. R17]
MLSIVVSLILVTIPLWACALYVRYTLQDDLGYYFEGWQPKAALVVFSLIIIVIYFVPVFLDAQIAAAMARRASALFSTVPCIGAAMIIFPEAITNLTGMNKIGADEAAIHKFYRGLGWVFLVSVFILMWVL